MEDIRNPHDKFFKKLFSKKTVAKGFFSYFLPPMVVKHLDLDTLENQNQSFVDKELQESFSDLLYRVKTDAGHGFIYLLVEHKSFQDPMVGFQLLKYMVRIMEQHLNQHKHAKSLPIVIPILLYHGKRQWKAGNHFHDLFDLPDTDFLRFIPDFDIDIHDLSQVSDGDLQMAAPAGAPMLLMKHIWNKTIMDAIEQLAQLQVKYGNLIEDKEDLEVMIRYVMEAAQNVDEKSLEKAIRNAENISGGMPMGTLAEKYINMGRKEGFEQGIEQGVEKGVEALKDVILDLLELRFGDRGLALGPQVNRLNKLDALKRLRYTIKTAKTLDEVRQSLSNHA